MLPTDGLGIDIGNPDAKNTILKVCNPYCGPCRRAHINLARLLESGVDINLKIIFAVPNNPDDKSFKPVNLFLSIQEQFRSQEVVQSAMEYWYQNGKNYQEILKKFAVKDLSTSTKDRIDAMDKWCTLQQIHGTPTIFINGYEMPPSYQINDLKYFLLE